MKLWIVSDTDDDCTRIVAVYTKPGLAAEHEKEMGGYTEEVEILSTLHPDVTDPEKVAQRAAEAAHHRLAYEERMRREAANAKLLAETKPNPPYMGLCHCETFSSDRNFVNDHGYCAYCGGFVPEVFRKHMGEAALQAEIDNLDLYKQKKMREIVGQSPA